MAPAAAALVLFLDAAVSDNDEVMRGLLRRFPLMGKRADALTEDERASLCPEQDVNHFWTAPHVAMQQPLRDHGSCGLVVEDTASARTLVQENNLQDLVYFGKNTDPVIFATVADVAEHLSEKRAQPLKVLKLMDYDDAPHVAGIRRGAD